MRQGITTRYLGPTNTQGSRYQATARKARNGMTTQRATVHADYALGIEENHTRAAKACAEKLGWHGLWVGGGNVNEDGFHYVCLAYGIPLGMYREAGKEGVDWFRVEPK